MNKKEAVIKTGFWALWAIVVAIPAFFIVYKAQWLIGDDAIIILHTGVGKPFLPSDTINPQGGRFFPFAYLIYDVLLLFSKGYISAGAHYVIHLVIFVVFVICMTKMSLLIMKDIKKEYGYGIALLFALICIGRTIPLFVNCFSTAWLSYTLIGGIMLFSFLFFEKQKWIYGVVALLLVNWICYCGESGFVFPLSMGMSTLIFQRKMITARCKAYCWMLIGSALLFLLLYAVLVLPYIDNIYDSSHGTTDNMLMNAIRMTFAQKIILVAFVVLVVRLVDMIRNNSKCNFFDSLLFTAAACCCGNFILRLNWTLYYNGVALIALPSILYFSINYLKEKWTMVLFVFLMVFYGRKIPGTIWENQQLRKETFEAVSNLYREMDKAEAVYWYMPVANGGNPQSLIVRDWKYNSLSTYLVWMKHEPDYKLPIAKEFHGGKNTIWLTTSENQTLFPDDNLLQENGELFFNSTGIEGYWIKE